MTRSNDKPEPLLDALAVLRRYRGRVIFVAFMVAVGVLGASLIMPRKYRAEAIFERRNDMVLSEIMTRGGPRSFQDPPASMLKEVTGHTAIDLTVSALESTADGRRFIQQHGLNTKSLRANIERGVIVGYEIASPELDRLRLVFVHENPEVARWTVNSLVQNYIDRTREQINQRLRQTSTFFTEEVARCRNHIEELETRKLTFEIEHADMLPTGSTGGLQDVLVEAQDQLDVARRDLDAATVRADNLQRSLGQTEETIIAATHGKNPELERLENQRRDMNAQLDQYVGVLKMTPKHPDLLALREQIAAIELLIQSTPEQVVLQTQQTQNPKRAEMELLLTEARTTLEAKKQEIAGLEDRVKSLREQTNRLFPIRSDYLKITRKVDEAQRQLAFWEDNLRTVQIALAAESGDRGVRLDFLKPCDPLTIPVSPNLSQVLAAALGLGLLGGVAAAFLAHRTDDTFSRGQKAAESVGLPLFGAISEIISARQRHVRRIRSNIIYPLNAALMLAVILCLTAVLYLNLQRPELYQQLRGDPSGFVRQRLTSAVLSITGVAAPAADAEADAARASDTADAADHDRTDPRHPRAALTSVTNLPGASDSIKE